MEAARAEREASAAAMRTQRNIAEQQAAHIDAQGLRLLDELEAALALPFSTKHAGEPHLDPRLFCQPNQRSRRSAAARVHGRLRTLPKEEERELLRHAIGLWTTAAPGVSDWAHATCALVLGREPTQ